MPARVGPTGAGCGRFTRLRGDSRRPGSYAVPVSFLRLSRFRRWEVAACCREKGVGDLVVTGVTPSSFRFSRGVGSSMKFPNAMGVSTRRALSTSVASVTLIAAAAVAMTPTPASATATAVPLGTVDSFAVLGGQSVTNTGPTQITGGLGVSPGTSITGFPPGLVNGAIHAADAVALQAQSDLTTAYNNAAGQASNAPITADLGGQTLAPGVYTAASSAGLTGTLTLDAANDPNAVWVFQIGSTLTTASASRVLLVNGASPCNVFWQIGSSATIGSTTAFVGTIMSQASTGLNSGATLIGRALARTASVTLNNNVITRPLCATTGGGTTTTGTTAGT